MQGDFRFDEDVIAAVDQVHWAGWAFSYPEIRGAHCATSMEVGGGTEDGEGQLEGSAGPRRGARRAKTSRSVASFGRRSATGALHRQPRRLSQRDVSRILWL